MKNLSFWEWLFPSLIIVFIIILSILMWGVIFEDISQTGRIGNDSLEGVNESFLESVNFYNPAVFERQNLIIQGSFGNNRRR